MLIVFALIGCSSTNTFQSKESLKIRLTDTYAIVENVDSLSIVEPVSNDTTATEPMPTLQVDPEYSFSGLVAEQNAVVWVNVLILPSGNVKEARIISSTDEHFNKNSLRAAVMWQFRPATKNGKAITCWAKIPFTFKLHK